MTTRQKAFKIAQDLINQDLVKGWQIYAKSSEHGIPQNLLANCCHILIANKKKREKEEKEIFEELRIEENAPYTQEPEDLKSETIVFPNVNFNIGE